MSYSQTLNKLTRPLFFLPTIPGENDLYSFLVHAFPETLNMVKLHPCVSRQEKCTRRNKSAHALQGGACLPLLTLGIQMVNEMT